MTEYYFYNTDANSLIGAPRPRYDTLIAQGFATTGGPRSFGEQLGQLTPGDMLLMYENGRGVVAAATVLEYWDGQAHEDMLYYKHGEGCSNEQGFEREYRLKVNWRRLSHSIGVQDVRERIGYTPRGAVRRIAKQRARVQEIIEET